MKRTLLALLVSASATAGADVVDVGVAPPPSAPRRWIALSGALGLDIAPIHTTWEAEKVSLTWRLDVDLARRDDVVFGAAVARVDNPSDGEYPEYRDQLALAYIAQAGRYWRFEGRVAAGAGIARLSSTQVDRMTSSRFRPLGEVACAGSVDIYAGFALGAGLTVDALPESLSAWSHNDPLARGPATSLTMTLRREL